MLRQKKIDEIYKRQMRKAVGEYSGVFLKKLEQLQKKWQEMPDDFPETRFIGPIIAHKLHPVNACIIADNLNYFEENYKNFYQDEDKILIKALRLACLSGSQKIAESLLKKLKADYLTEGYEFILSYVLSSGEHEWAKTIATVMAKHRKDMPQDVWLFANSELAFEIKKIFDSYEPNSYEPKRTADSSPNCDKNPTLLGVKGFHGLALSALKPNNI